MTRRIVSGLPAHLRPGGDFHCTCVMTDRETPVEARVREMLGPQESEFDVVVLTGNTRTPTALYEGRTRAGVMSRDEARARIARFSELGIRQLVRLSMLVRRHGADAPAVTIRRALDASTKPPIAEELLKQERLARSPR